MQTEEAGGSVEEAPKPKTESCGQDYLTEPDPPSYSYNELLERAVDFLHQHNPEYSEKRRYNLKPPQLMKSKACNCADISSCE